MIPLVLISALFSVGVAGLIISANLLKKLMALNIVQVSIILLFLELSYKKGGMPPISDLGTVDQIVNPLPHALMLTAIVVGIATTGLGLALLIQIQRHFGTLDASELKTLIRQDLNNSGVPIDA